MGQFDYDGVQVGQASACLVLIFLTARQTRQVEACPTKQSHPLPKHLNPELTPRYYAGPVCP